MKKIYLAVFIALVISAILFIASLFYLDSEKRRSYNFIISMDGHEIGSVKIDRFITDENLVYKSNSHLPFAPLLTESRSRLTLDRRYALINYSREDTGQGAGKSVFLENINDNLSFLGISFSEFAYLPNIPIKHNSFVLEEYSPVTYLPIVENYNFSMGRAQAFNVITDEGALLPPMKRLLTLTSIKDDYIKVGKRKIKVECLLIRMKNKPQGMLFVTKSGRSLVGMEFPDKKLKIMRAFSPKEIVSKKFNASPGAQKEEEVRFNNKKTTIAGTITLPAREGRHPAVLLIGGSGENDREEQGLFTYLADMLGKNSFLALRFDRRGIGASDGNSSYTTDAEGVEDAGAALTYLLQRKDVDTEKISIIGHGKGAYYASKIASDRKDIKSIILMAPIISLTGQTELNFDNINEMASKRNWDQRYVNLIIKSRMETIEKVRSTKNNWIYILKKRCFAGKMREALEGDPSDIIRKVECPVLILHGKEDELVLPKDALNLDKALEDSGNKNHNLIYYGYLGHFFGKLVNDGVHTFYHETDPAVLDNIREWLNNNP